MLFKVLGEKPPSSHPKKVNEWYTKKLGMPPTRFIKLWNKTVFKNEVPQGMEVKVNKYCRSYGGYINRTFVINLVKNKYLVEEMEEKGMQNLIPTVVRNKQVTTTSLKELKAQWGKANWKHLCSSSYSRVKMFVDLGRKGLDVRELRWWDLRKLPISQIPSSLLIRNKFTSDLEIINLLKREKKLTLSFRAQRPIIDIVQDTRRMLSILNKNPKTSSWDLNKWREVHDKCTEEITNRMYSKDKIKWINEIKSLEDKLSLPEGVTIEILDSPYLISEEGDKMHHCVAGYIDRVYNGSYLVISISECGKRYSTLGINISTTPRGKRYFSFNQHYMACNQPIEDKIINHLADSIIEELNKF